LAALCVGAGTEANIKDVVYGEWWTKRPEGKKLTDEDAKAQQELVEWRIRIFTGHFREHVLFVKAGILLERLCLDVIV
jgi:hypothetical protein